MQSTQPKLNIFIKLAVTEQKQLTLINRIINCNIADMPAMKQSQNKNNDRLCILKFEKRLI